jgi:5-(carboxyamino)imidazole ribonucleotide mutase
MTQSMNPAGKPLVGIVMGSKSDLPTMQATLDTLTSLGIAHEVRVMSAHRTPDIVAEYARAAEGRGLEVLIAAAGGAAHLAGVVASMTVLPVLGVPMQTSALNGLDSLLSTVQMPGGVPVATLAIGKAGATNAAILAAEILGGKYPEIRQRVKDLREENRRKILAGE